MSNNLRSSLTLSVKDKNLNPTQNTKFTTSSFDVTALQSVFSSKNYSSIIWRNCRLISEYSYATAAPLDFDNGLTIQDAEAILAKHNLNYALITSKSHTHQDHRFRVIIPFKRKIYSPENYKRVIQELRDTLFPAMDPNAMDAARFFFHSPDTAYYSCRWDGQDYDPDQSLGEQIPDSWNDNLIVVTDKKQSVYANLVDEKTPILCPFHEDSNHSAFVKKKANTEDRFIHCSACGKTFWKVEPPLETRSERFWSHGTDVFEFILAGESFAMSAIGKDKFSLFVNAMTRAEKQNAMKYLLDNKHIPHLRLVNHIGDPTVEKSNYVVERETGTVIVKYTPAPIIVEDNEFIETYLTNTFGDHKSFVKQWLAVYCYENYLDLPTLIFKGPRGSGKNTFAEMVYSIYPSLSTMWDAERKNFTPEAEKKLLIADESASADIEQYKLIKAYAGQKYVHVNKKYSPQYDVRNNMNIILLSNSAFPVYFSRDEIPTSDQNNQFFVFEFKPFSGSIDPELDKKLEERIGYYVRTVLKDEYSKIDFTGNRYSIRTPITLEELGLFEGNITEEEGIADKILDKVLKHSDEPSSAYGEFLKNGWLPIELISDSISGSKLGVQKVIKTLKEQGYLVMRAAEKKQYNKNRYRCHQMTEKLKKLK
jgi:predicted transcriptional regulator